MLRPVTAYGGISSSPTAAHKYPYVSFHFFLQYVIMILISTAAGGDWS
ncbi:hypothetical protein HMPREF1147_1268 [Selenomonas sp. FOBRC9]|nr:hypothetical protein HMPREF1147_1268 [Selenomonas sp. FOBRC9]